MKTKSRLVASIVIALPALAASNSYADIFHYNNTIIGDRANGFGGAYTAIADDPSGLYHNPAGIVYSGQNNLSASVNAFNIASTTYKNVFGGGEDFVRESSALLPNFFGISQPLGGGIVGFSYAVTDSIIEDQDSQFYNTGPNTEYFNLNINITDSTYKMGPSYAYEISPELAVGITLYMHVRNSEQITNQWLDISNDLFEWQNLYVQEEETGIEPILGIMWSPLQDISLGLAIRKTTIINSNSTQQHVCASNDVPGTIDNQCSPEHNGINFVTGTVRNPSKTLKTTNRDMPVQINMGLAYFPSQHLILASDIAYYTRTDTAEPVFNLSVGGEYYVTNTWALRAGFFTNNANTSKVAAGGTNQAEHINLTGLSFSVSRFTRNSSITVGLGHSFGTGDAQLFGGLTDIQKVDVVATSLYVSSSYSY